MKIQFCSDLHLEFEENQEWLWANPIAPKGDILIIAGDTFYLDDDPEEYEFFDEVSADFEETYIIPGNHEYYGGHNVATATEVTFKELRKNVFLVNNYTLEKNGYQIIFSTMWSEINEHMHYIQDRMNDFWKINFNGLQFTPHHMNRIHDKCFNFIKKELRKSKKNILVTHHLPSRFCNALEFRHSLLNEAFCVDKTEFIHQAPIDYWIYGHSHRNMPDIEIGGTKLITNQLGYTFQREDKLFSTDRVFEI